VARGTGEAAIESAESSESVSGETDVVALRVESLSERRLEIVVESVENLAHDLGNALMSLSNYTELAMHPTTERGRREQYASRLTDLAYSAIDLVRQLRSVATNGGAEPRAVPIAELVAPAVAAMKSGLRHRRIELVATDSWPEERVRVRPDDAIHAIIDLLDVARGACLGAAREIELRVVSESDQVLVVASSTSPMATPDEFRLDLFRALAARAGGTVVVPLASPRAIGVAFHRAD